MNTPLANMKQPMQTAPSFALPQMPRHEAFTEKDTATALLHAEDKKRMQDEAMREERSMKGFLKVFTCPKCKKRLKPAVAGGEAQYGECPYCKGQVYPESKSLYVGKHQPITNRYSGADNESFQAGAKVDGLQTTRRINSRQLPRGAVAVQR